MREYPPVIGLIGKKRAGKDTIAAELVASHGFTRLAFADELKAAALAADPLVQIADHVWRLSKAVERLGWERAKGYPDVRGYLQRFGVAARQVDTDFWLRPVDAAILRRDNPVVITDVRFANEAALIRARGGSLVRVERPAVDDGDTHTSESALPDVAVDVIVRNDGSVADLVTKASSLVYPQGR